MRPRTMDLTLLAFSAGVVIAGLNFVAVRFSNRELAPFWGAGLRFGVASLLFLTFALATRRAFPRGKALFGAVIYGVLAFGASYAFAYYGLVRAPAAIASVVIALVPLMTVLLAGVQGLERITLRGVAGGGVAAVGIGVAFWDLVGASVPFLSLLALLCTAIAIAQSGIVVKRFPRVDPFVMNGVGMAVGAALLLALSWTTREPWILPKGTDARMAVGYLITIGSVGLFFVYLFVLSRWTASAASYATVLSPLVTVAAGALLAGERVGLAFGAGAALVFAGVYVGALSREPPRPPKQFK